jgi:hypothetical protein
MRMGEDEVGKKCRRVNMMQILSTHVCKWNNETIPGMGGRRIKKMMERVNSTNFCKCHNNKKKWEHSKLDMG